MDMKQNAISHAFSSLGFDCLAFGDNSTEDGPEQGIYAYEI